MANKQTINRAEKTNFSTIRNEVLIDTKLSDSAKILLIRMLNNSEEWVINVSFYRKQMNWSTDKLSAAMNSLEKNGYLIRKRIEGGWEYIINEIGISENHISEKQICGKQISENQTLYKINFTKNNLRKEKEKEKDEEVVVTNLSTGEFFEQENQQPQQPIFENKFLTNEEVVDIFKSNFEDKTKGERIARTAIENGRSFKPRFAYEDIKRYCDKVKETDNIQGSTTPTTSFENKEEEIYIEAPSIQKWLRDPFNFNDIKFICSFYDVNSEEIISGLIEFSEAISLDDFKQELIDFKDKYETSFAFIAQSNKHLIKGQPVISN